MPLDDGPHPALYQPTEQSEVRDKNQIPPFTKEEVIQGLDINQINSMLRGLSKDLRAFIIKFALNPNAPDSKDMADAAQAILDLIAAGGGGGTVIRGFGADPVEIKYRPASGIGAPATSISSFPIQPINLRQLRFGVHLDALGNPIIAGNNVVITFNSGLGSPFVVTGVGTLDVKLDVTAEATMDNMIAGLNDITLQTGSGDLVSAIIAVTKLSPTDIDATYIVNGAFPNAQFAFVDITAGLPVPSPSLYSGGVDVVAEVIQVAVVSRFAQEVAIGGHRILVGGSQIEAFPSIGPTNFPDGAVRSDGFQLPEVGFTVVGDDIIDVDLSSFTDQVIAEFDFNSRGVIIEPKRDNNDTGEAVLSWTFKGVPYSQNVRKVAV